MTNWRWLTGLAAIGALLAMLCWIEVRPLWLDEAFASKITALPRDVWIDLVCTREANMILHNAFLRLWTGAQEAPIWWVRLPSVLAIAGACILFASLARRLLDDPRLAVVATFLFATNGFVLGHGIQARGYAFVILLVVASTRLLLASLDRAIEGRGDRGTSLGYALTAGLLGTAHVLAPSVLLVHVFLFLASRRPLQGEARPRLTRRTGVALLVAFLGAGTMALVVFLQGRGGQIDWIDPPGFWDVYHGVMGLTGDETFTMWFTLLILAVFFTRCARRPTRERLAIALGLLVPIVGPLLLTLAMRPLWVERYLAPASPFLSLAIADGIGRVLERARSQRTSSRARVSFELAIVAAPLCLVVFIQGPNAVEVDWRGAGEIIEEEHQPGDALLTFPWYLRTALDPWIAEAVRRELLCVWPDLSFEEYAPYPKHTTSTEVLEEDFPPAPSGFLITSWHPFDDERIEQLLRRLREHGAHVRTFELRRVTIHRWEDAR